MSCRRIRETDFPSASNTIAKEPAFTEKDEPVSGRGDAVNTHDILTGSDPADGDTPCANWTSNGEGSAIAGHHDRRGLRRVDSNGLDVFLAAKKNMPVLE